MGLDVPEVVSDSVWVRVEALFRTHVDGVYNVAFRVLWNRSDAEDVVQATFVKAFSGIDQLRDSGKERSWLFQVAYRESIAVLRRRRDVPHAPNEMPTEVCATPSPDDRVISSAIASELSRALQRLAPAERLAVVLRDVEGLPMREVAQVMGVGLSAAKMRVHRGRQSLRVLLEGTEVR